MKNQLMQFPDDILKQIHTLRKISPNDKFPCFGCFDDKVQKLTCKICSGSGFVFGSHPMVQFSEDFIEKKINYLKKQEQAKNNPMISENCISRSNTFPENHSCTENDYSYRNHISHQIKNTSIDIEQNHHSNSISNDNNSQITKSKVLNEDSSDQEDQNIKHHGFCCDQCKQDPILGYRYHCQSCEDYDLCSKCYKKGLHHHDFIIFKQIQGVVRSSIHPKHDNLLKNIRKSIRKID